MADEEKTPEINPEEINAGLIKELGLEVEPEGFGELDEFYKDVGQNAEPEPEQPAEEPKGDEEQKWIHEPTGREFDNELDYLKYNSGWTADRLGTENKELRERLERLETGQKDQPQEKQTYDEKEIMKQIWPDLDEETYDDPAMKLFYKGLDRTAGILQQQFEQKLSDLKGENDSLKASLEEDKVRAQFGLEPNVEQKILEQHPGLKALGPKDRMAVMKDLVASKEGAEKPPTKLSDKIPQQRAEDHVEGSVISGTPAESSDQALEDKLFEMDDDKRLSVLGQMFEKSGLLNEREGSF